jgi:uncharacterized protein YjbJ (UPF0337 family)
MSEKLTQMAWDRIIEDWKEFKQKFKGRRGKHTDADLTVLNPQRQFLENKNQERYGYHKHQARFKWDEWL